MEEDVGRPDNKAQVSYVVEFTPLAKAIAERHGGLEALESQVRGELTPPWGPSDINDLFFHICAFGGSHFDEDVPNFIVKPTGNGVLLVDVCGDPVEEDQPLDSGPFKSMKVRYTPEAFD